MVSKTDRTSLRNEIEKQLRHQPNEETRNRKPLRPGHVSEWELRVDNMRVFYDVDEEGSVVRIVAIGYKERSKLFFRGQEYEP